MSCNYGILYVLFWCGSLDFEGDWLGVGITQAQDLRDFVGEGACGGIVSSLRRICPAHIYHIRLKPSSGGLRSTDIVPYDGDVISNLGWAAAALPIWKLGIVKLSGDGLRRGSAGGVRRARSYGYGRLLVGEDVFMGKVEDECFCTSPATLRQPELVWKALCGWNLEW